MSEFSTYVELSPLPAAAIVLIFLMSGMCIAAMLASCRLMHFCRLRGTFTEPAIRLFVVGIVSGALAPTSVIASDREEKVRAFLDTVWADRPSRLDLLIKHKHQRPPRSEGQVRKAVEATYASLAANGHPELNTRKAIDRSVEETMKGEVGPFYSLRRYRLHDDLQCLDIVPQSEDNWGTEMPFSETRINGRRENGVVESIHYNHVRKTAVLTADQPKPFWAYEDIWRISTVGAEVSTVVRGATAHPTDKMVTYHGMDVPTVTRDPGKITAVLRGTSNAITIAADSDRVNDVDADRFRIGFVPSSPISVDVYTMRDNSARVLRVDFRESEIVRKRVEASAFDGDGFPHFWKRTVFDETGKKERDVEELHVLRVAINESIAESTFTFHVPDGYAGATILPDKTILQQPNGTITEEKRTRPLTIPVPTSARTFLFIANGLALCAAVAVSLWRWSMRRSRNRNSRG